MKRLAVLAAAALVVVSCGSGKSIITAGRQPPVVTQPAPVTLPPGETLPVGQTLPPVETTIAPTTTAALLDTLPNCPTEALASATGPVELTFWHGMNGPLADELQKLTDAYNASQSKVKVTLIQGSYEQTIDKYLQSGQASRPDLVQMPEYMVQQMVDSQSVVPVEACMKSSGYDTSAFLPTGLGAYATQGVQWSIPFNISNPVLFYNKKMFAAAGLDPEKPPVSLDDLRADSQAIVKSGAAKYGLALDSGFDSGGGWYIEQWFAKAGEFYADNQNGRSARATQVLYNNATGQSLLTFMQSMLTDGLAVNVGDNSTTGFDNLLKLGRQRRAGGDDHRHVGVDRPGDHRVGRRSVPADHQRRCRCSGDARSRRQARCAGRWRFAVGRRFRRRRAHRGSVGLHHLPHGRAAAERVGVGHRVRAGAHRCLDARPVEDHVGDRPALQGALRPAVVVARRADVGRPDPRPAARGAHGDGASRRRDLRRRRCGDVACSVCGASRRPDRRLQRPQRLAAATANRRWPRRRRWTKVAIRWRPRTKSRPHLSATG